ncbi:hypothetical protein C8R45DRAFT_1080483 [Mycena sanguinolenta]|nr:hypothetical protein C8R45DRAFT_1080483 [Mycena sanguinolenta]
MDSGKEKSSQQSGEWLVNENGIIEFLRVKVRILTHKIGDSGKEGFVGPMKAPGLRISKNESDSGGQDGEDPDGQANECAQGEQRDIYPGAAASIGAASSVTAARSTTRPATRSTTAWQASTTRRPTSREHGSPLPWRQHGPCRHLHRPMARPSFAANRKVPRSTTISRRSFQRAAACSLARRCLRMRGVKVAAGDRASSSNSVSATSGTPPSDQYGVPPTRWAARARMQQRRLVSLLHRGRSQFPSEAIFAGGVGGDGCCWELGFSDTFSYVDGDAVAALGPAHEFYPVTPPSGASISAFITGRLRGRHRVHEGDKRLERQRDEPEYDAEERVAVLVMQAVRRLLR